MKIYVQQFTYIKQESFHSPAAPNTLCSEDDPKPVKLFDSVKKGIS